MKRRNLKAYSPVSNNSAGTLIIVLWQIFQQAILFSSKKYKKKTWHFNFAYVQFPFRWHTYSAPEIKESGRASQ